MKIYFYNSYQNSFMGYQFLTLDAETKTLKDESKNVLPQKERGLLFNSGARLCLMNGEGTITLSIRGLEGCNGTSSSKWYMNILLQSSEDSADEICNLLVRYAASPHKFADDAAACFKEERVGEISYSVDYNRFEKLFCAYDENDILMSPFYAVDHVEIKRFANMLKNVRRQMDAEGVYLLVPEADKAYFLKQNPDFEGTCIKYLFTLDIFDNLIAENMNAFENKTNSAAQRTSVKWKNAGLITAMITVGVLLTIKLVICACKKLSGRRR